MSHPSRWTGRRSISGVTDRIRCGTSASFTSRPTSGFRTHTSMRGGEPPRVGTAKTPRTPRRGRGYSWRGRGYSWRGGCLGSGDRMPSMRPGGLPPGSRYGPRPRGRWPYTVRPRRTPGGDLSRRRVATGRRDSRLPGLPRCPGSREHSCSVRPVSPAYPRGRGR